MSVWAEHAAKLLHGFPEWEVAGTVIFSILVRIRRVAQDQIEGIVLERQRTSLGNDLRTPHGVSDFVHCDATHPLNGATRAMENVRCIRKQSERPLEECRRVLSIQFCFLEAATAIPNPVDPSLILHCDWILRKFFVQMCNVRCCIHSLAFFALELSAHRNHEGFRHRTIAGSSKSACW